MQYRRQVISNHLSAADTDVSEPLSRERYRRWRAPIAIIAFALLLATCIVSRPQEAPRPQASKVAEGYELTPVSSVVQHKHIAQPSSQSTSDTNPSTEAEDLLPYASPAALADELAFASKPPKRSKAHPPIVFPDPDTRPPVPDPDPRPPVPDPDPRPPLPDPDPRPPVPDPDPRPPVPDPDPRPPVPDPDPRPPPPTPKPPPPAPRPEPGGQFLVQILATPFEESICDIWNALKTESPDLFAYAEKTVSRLDSDDGGVLFRLRAGAFSTRHDADRFCRILKSRGHACYVVKRESG